MEITKDIRETIFDLYQTSAITSENYFLDGKTLKEAGLAMYKNDIK